MVKAKSNNLPLSIYKDLVYDMAKSRKAYQKIVEENKKTRHTDIFFPSWQGVSSYA